MTDLVTSLAAFKARAVPAANDDHSTQLAVNGLVWSYQLLAARADALDVLALVRDTLDIAERLDVDASGLAELAAKLEAETSTRIVLMRRDGR